MNYKEYKKAALAGNPELRKEYDDYFTLKIPAIYEFDTNDIAVGYY